MLGLIKADFYKMIKAKSFWICGAIMLAIGAITIAVQNYVFDGEGISAVNSIQSFMGSSVVIFTAIIVALFVAGEFGNGTIKNITSRSFNRTQVYASKCIVSYIMSLLLVTAYLVFNTLLATVFWGFGTLTGSLAAAILESAALEALLLAGVTALFVMIGMICRNSGAAIAISICVIEFAGLFLQLGSLFINKFFHKTVDLSQYWITSVMDEIAHATVNSSLVLRSVGVAVAFIVVATVIGMFSFQKRDIK